MDPNQIVIPAPANNINVVQNITPTAVNLVTPTAPLTLVPQPTPVVQANINDVTPDNGNNAGLIVGVVIAVVVIIATAAVAIVGLVVFYQIWKKKNDSKFPRTFNSRRLSNKQQRCKFDDDN